MKCQYVETLSCKREVQTQEVMHNLQPVVIIKGASSHTQRNEHKLTKAKTR